MMTHEQEQDDRQKAFDFQCHIEQLHVRLIEGERCAAILAAIQKRATIVLLSAGADQAAGKAGGACINFVAELSVGKWPRVKP